jgi:hypothetical protein
MGQHPEAALPLAGRIGPPAEGTPEPPLVPAERGLGLPPLAVHPPVPAPLRLLAEPLDHLPPVLGLGPLAAPVAAVERDDGGPHPEVLPAVPVVLLGIERGVGQHPVPGDGQRRLGHDGLELRGVVGRAGRDAGPGEEVAVRIDGDGDLGPQPRGVLAAGSLEEVAGGVAALQPGGIDSRGRPVADQAAVGCGRGGAVEEDDELPFLSSRFWA